MPEYNASRVKIPPKIELGTEGVWLISHSSGIKLLASRIGMRNYKSVSLSESTNGMTKSTCFVLKVNVTYVVVLYEQGGFFQASRS